MSSIMVVLVSLFIFTSCNKDEDEITDKKVNNKSMTEMGLYNVYNPNNPFDIIGIRHNLYLDAFGRQLANIDGSTFYTNNDYSHYTQSFENALNVVLSSEIQNNSSSYTQQDLIDMRTIDSNPSSLISNMLEGDNAKYMLLDEDFSTMEYYDNTVANYYDQIKAALIECVNENITINQFLDIVTDIENVVLTRETYHQNYETMQQNTISNVDALLISISVLKHSLVYWNDALTNRDNAWHDAFIYLLSDLNSVYSDLDYKGLFSWFKKGWTKFKQYLTGGDTGEIAHAVVLGILPVVSFDVAGAAVGALGGCVGSAVGAVIGPAGGILFGTAKHQK